MLAIFSMAIYAREATMLYTEVPVAESASSIAENPRPSVSLLCAARGLDVKRTGESRSAIASAVACPLSSTLRALEPASLMMQNAQPISGETYFLDEYQGRRIEGSDAQCSCMQTLHQVVSDARS